VADSCYLTQATQESLVVLGVLKDRFTLNSPDNDMMKRAGSIYAGLAGHTGNMPEEERNVNISITLPFSTFSTLFQTS
jgi:hypothetical protein